jgi:hypothetical protein
MNSLLPILMICLEGNYICERDYSPPPIEYYKKGEACYINGEFYQSCPGIVQELKAHKRKPWD